MTTTNSTERSETARLRLSARLMVGTGDAERQVEFYVRAVRTGERIFPLPGASRGGRDAWMAYREEPVFVEIDGERTGLLRVVCVSCAASDTAEEAATEMYAAVATEMVRGARLVAGDLPEELLADVRAAIDVNEAAAKDPVLASDLSDA